MKQVFLCLCAFLTCWIAGCGSAENETGEFIDTANSKADGYSIAPPSEEEFKGHWAFCKRGENDPLCENFADETNKKFVRFFNEGALGKIEDGPLSGTFTEGTRNNIHLYYFSFNCDLIKDFNDLPIKDAFFIDVKTTPLENTLNVVFSIWRESDNQFIAAVDNNYMEFSDPNEETFTLDYEDLIGTQHQSICTVKFRVRARMEKAPQQNCVQKCLKGICQWFCNVFGERNEQTSQYAGAMNSHGSYALSLFYYKFQPWGEDPEGNEIDDGCGPRNKLDRSICARDIEKVPFEL
ncbi:MAG: hypothetical protein V1754_01120 [Pseudomonadota bacterium]